MCGFLRAPRYFGPYPVDIRTRLARGSRSRAPRDRPRGEIYYCQRYARKCAVHRRDPGEPPHMHPRYTPTLGPPPPPPRLFSSRGGRQRLQLRGCSSHYPLGLQRLQLAHAPGPAASELAHCFAEAGRLLVATLRVAPPRCRQLSEARPESVNSQVTCSSGVRTLLVRGSSPVRHTYEVWCHGVQGWSLAAQRST